MSTAKAIQSCGGRLVPDMRNEATVAVIIPALNEEQAIGKVISEIPPWIDDLIVVDNGSTDRTAEIARAHRSRVVSELQRGYGAACLRGIAALNAPDVVVFLDGDFSDRPHEMALLVDPITNGEADMVIGSRVLGQREAGALTPQALFGNWLACILIRLFWKVRYTDLGPFRAIRYATLKRLGMCDRDYGWPVEMQIKAARLGVRIKEVPVSYRRRVGKSKISRTVKGVLHAGAKILFTIFLSLIDTLRQKRGEKIKDRLIIFTRYPEPEKTKTRLIPVLGSEGAAELHRQMAEHTLKRARELERCRLVSFEVRYDGGSRSLMEQWLGAEISFSHQGKGDLGARMARAFHEAFQAGMNRVVIAGTDCPGLTTDLMQKAFEALRQTDVVIGPANDGGYYLIGLRKAISQLFLDMPWGTEDLLERTIRVAKDLGLSVLLLEPLDDIDRPEDISVWEGVRCSSPIQFPGMRISIIIPTLNESTTIAQSLLSTRSGSDVDVTVVDAGSRDETVELAISCGAKVINSTPGRARQMNAGAAVATGDVLLFLHADTCLPEGFDSHVRRIMAEPCAAAGAFELSIDAPLRGLRIIERLANWRSRHLQLPYGDQAIFLRAGLFRDIGGFPEIPIMEDFELIRRLRRRGRIAIARVPAITSGRRWEELGMLRTTLINQGVLLAYHLGIARSHIARWSKRRTDLFID
jgi:rSAM/selenodomain-associated transferase 2/rSAM/selenodomain-associated transferase 1